MLTQKLMCLGWDSEALVDAADSEADVLAGLQRHLLTPDSEADGLLILM